jgi:hypothetical protein
MRKRETQREREIHRSRKIEKKWRHKDRFRHTIEIERNRERKRYGVSWCCGNWERGKGWTDRDGRTQR